VLTAAVHIAPEDGVALEIGTYCGYSAARIAAVKLSRCSSSNRTPCVITLEVDLAHAAIARNVLAYAGLAHVVEVVVGHSEDTLPWLVSQLSIKFRRMPISFLFLDQRGSRYEADVATLEESGLLGTNGIIVADNVLKPGAPLFLWKLAHNPDFTTKVVSVTEFAMSGVEDWMIISMYHPLRWKSEQHSPPEEARKLEWEAERMRSRAHQPDHGGRGIDFLDWADFSTRMRAGFQRMNLGSLTWEIAIAELETRRSEALLAELGSPPVNITDGHV